MGVMFSPSVMVWLVGVSVSDIAGDATTSLLTVRVTPM